MKINGIFLAKLHISYCILATQPKFLLHNLLNTLHYICETFKMRTVPPTAKISLNLHGRSSGKPMLNMLEYELTVRF